MIRNSFITVAIDGGAASGKSTTARALAQRYHWLHVDTGNHYRALTYILMQQGIAPENNEAIVRQLPKLKLRTAIDGSQACILIDGNSFTAGMLRAPEVTNHVSKIAAVKEVRALLLTYQRNIINIARERGFAGVIMEGRDIGSVVIPNADWRFFFEADLATRAYRRAMQGQEDMIALRDRQDVKREIAPLQCPPSAIRINTSKISLEKVIERVSTVIDNRDSG